MISTEIFKTNPLARRLSQQRRRLHQNKVFYISLAVGLLLSLLALIDVVFFEFIDQPRVDWLQVIFFVISLSLLISLPLLLTFAATAVTVTYIKSSEYPFLLLTPVSEKEITQGYLLATFYRSRVFFAFSLSLAIGLSITMKSGGLQFNLYPDTFGFGQTESILKHIVMGCLIAAFIGALCLFGSSMGILLGMWWRHTLAANTVSVIILFIGTFWWLDNTGKFLQSLGYSGFAYDFLHALLFIPFPLFLAWLCQKISQRWARKPHFTR